MSMLKTEPGNMPRLFPELIASIIDELCDDKVALAACSLVSRTWVPLSRPHLFHRLKLDAGMENFTTSEFLHMFATIPDVTRYVRELAITGARPGLGLNVLIFALHELDSILCSFPRMECLELSSITLFGVLATQGGDAHKGTHSVPSLPTPRPLRRLALKNLFSPVESFLDIMHVFSPIQELNCMNVVFYYPMDVIPISVNPSTQLCPIESLTLRSLPSFKHAITLVCQTLSMRSIRHLDVTCRTSEDILSLQDVISEIGPSLQYCRLDFVIFSQSFDFAHPITLDLRVMSKCTSLRTLHIDLASKAKDDLLARYTWRMACKVLPHVLEDTSSLRHLIFSISLMPTATLEGRTGHADDETMMGALQRFEWENVRETLQGLDQLESVSFYGGTMEYSSLWLMCMVQLQCHELHGEAKDYIARNLPELAAKGILQWSY